jgi:hypothetical protein
MIRHTEMNTISLSDAAHVDYLFHRMFSLVRFLLRKKRSRRVVAGLLASSDGGREDHPSARASSYSWPWAACILDDRLFPAVRTPPADVVP